MLEVLRNSEEEERKIQELVSIHWYKIRNADDKKILQGRRVTLK